MNFEINNKMAKQIKEEIYQPWIYLQKEIIARERKEQIKTLEKRIKKECHEEEENKKLFLWYYQLKKAIGEGKALVNPYNENTVKKVAAFLEK